MNNKRKTNLFEAQPEEKVMGRTYRKYSQIQRNINKKTQENGTEQRPVQKMDK